MILREINNVFFKMISKKLPFHWNVDIKYGIFRIRRGHSKTLTDLKKSTYTLNFDIFGDMDKKRIFQNDLSKTSFSKNLIFKSDLKITCFSEICSKNHFSIEWLIFLDIWTKNIYSKRSKENYLFLKFWYLRR